jgi:hypothetical protein
MLVLGQAAPPPPAAAPPQPAAAQPAPAAPQPGATQAPGQPVFSQEQIDQIIAPIALYPDDLLAQILIAATYPLEVVQAQRWAADPENAKLKGDQLAAALEPQTWDPSVKSLVPLPQVLMMMNDKLDWTQRLGDAVLAQQADVMASVQRLRKKAADAGTLTTTEQQTIVTKTEAVVLQPERPDVVTQRETIVIQPTNPEVVYVPTYNPSTAYGTWPYPAYPPVYYPPPPAYYPGYYPGSALVAGLGFGLGVAAIASLSGCCNSNWGGGNVNINANRYNNINAANIRSGRASALSSNTTNWRHDPSHRGGVAYRDSASRQNFQRQGARPTPAAVSRDFRGYDGGQRGLGQGTSRPPGGGAALGQRQAGGAGAARQPRSGTSPAGQRQAGAAARAGQGPSAARQPSAAARAGGTGGMRAQSSRQPAAFQGMGNGSQVRAQANRGRSSMSSARSAPSSMGGVRGGGGGGRGGGGGGRGGGRR